MEHFSWSWFGYRWAKRTHICLSVQAETYYILYMIMTCLHAEHLLNDHDLCEN